MKNFSLGKPNQLIELFKFNTNLIYDYTNNFIVVIINFFNI